MNRNSVQLTEYLDINLCSRLRHCATPRNVAVSIPDGVIGIYY